MEYCEWHLWKPTAWLHVGGSDALSFLQGQFTNDLRGLPESGAGAVYGLWLNQKGRVLADSFVLRAEKGGLWVGSYFSAAQEVRGRLDSYIIADDVVVEDETGAWVGVTIFGGPETVAAISGGREFGCFGGRRGGEGTCTELVLPWSEAEVVRERLAGGREIGAAEMERRRVVAGIPAVPQDIGPGDLPNEGGLELSAISYTKGCYLGQEVMARLKSMGQVRRRLGRVRGDGPAPAAGEALLQAGQKVGELRSVVPADAGFVGMAMLALLNFRSGEPLWAGGTELHWEKFL